MSLDIKNGDVLVVGSVEYVIRDVSHWETHGFEQMSVFDDYFATVDCSTKRPPSVAVGGVPVENLTGLSCAPIDPIDHELRLRLGTNASVKWRQTFITNGTDYANLYVEEIFAG